MMHKLLIVLLIITGLCMASRADEPSLDALIDEATISNQQAPLDQTRALLDRLLERFELASPEQQARILYLQIRWLALAGEYDQSLALAEQALRDPPPGEQAAALYRLTANVAIYFGAEEQAFRYLHRAIDILAQANNHREHALTLLMASQLLAEAGNTHRAIHHALDGLEFAQQVDEPRIACALTVLATATLNADGQAERALELASAELPGCRQVNDPVVLGSLLNKLADTHLNLALLEPAESLLSEAGQLLDGRYEEGVRFNRLLRARWLLARGRASEALTQTQSLVGEFETLGLWRRLDAILEIQAQALATLDQPEALYRTRQQQLIARERLLDRHRLLSLANAEVGFEALRNQHQLDLLAEQERVSVLREQTHQAELNMRIMLGLTVAGGLLLLSILLWHSRRERRRFVHLAEHDGLTGLANHTHFFAQFEDQVERAQGNLQTLTLILADIDHFKRINDRLGHPAGDAILRRTAAALNSAFDSHGFSGRIGGEEFAICLPGVSAAQARRLAEELRSELGRYGVGDDHHRLSLSFGIAELKSDERPEQLRDRADRALYAAKRRGRDQIMLA